MGLDVFYGDLQKPMPKSIKEKNQDWVTANIEDTTWILNFACMVSRLDHRSYEKRVFKLLSSDDSFDEENDIKIDYQTKDGDIVCYYSTTRVSNR